MLEVFIYIIIFIIGIYFGSFFTLATYRIPKKENITYQHSYCPNCHHKLGILELIPLFSYLFLGGKCKHCKQKISIRYFLLEILGGIAFVLFAISIHLSFTNLDINKLVYFMLGMLYFSSLFILAGIDKEKRIIQKSVLIYGVIISIGYMIYSYTLQPDNVYAYVIYLCMMIILLFADTALLRKNLSYNYSIQLLILLLYILIFSGVYQTTFTVIITILAIGFKNILISIRDRKKPKLEEQTFTTPIAFFMCTSNILVIIITNFILNYFIKA